MNKIILVIPYESEKVSYADPLASLGFQVTKVETAILGIHEIQKETPDLLIIDDLPKQRMYDVLIGSVRRLERFAELPILLLLLPNQHAEYYECDKFTWTLHQPVKPAMVVRRITHDILSFNMDGHIRGNNRQARK